MKTISTAFLIVGFTVVSQASLAECRKSTPDLLGSYSVRCDDGNQYQVQKNELMGTTRMQGYNPNTGSRWSQEYRENGILGPSMSGTDARGNRYNCRMNTLTNQWQCN